MNKNEFVSETLRFYKKKDLNKKQVAGVLESAFKVMEKVLKKEKRFGYPKFGTFLLKKRKERLWKSPLSGKTLLVKARSTIGFRPAEALKNSLNSNGNVKSITIKRQDLHCNSSPEVASS